MQSTQTMFPSDMEWIKILFITRKYSIQMLACILTNATAYFKVQHNFLSKHTLPASWQILCFLDNAHFLLSSLIPQNSPRVVGKINQINIKPSILVKTGDLSLLYHLLEFFKSRKSQAKIATTKTYKTASKLPLSLKKHTVYTTK